MVYIWGGGGWQNCIGLDGEIIATPLLNCRLEINGGGVVVVVVVVVVLW